MSASPWARGEQASGPGGFSHTMAVRLTVLAFLHDCGKLNTGFQFMVRDRNEFPGAPQKTNHISVALVACDVGEKTNPKEQTWTSRNLKA